MPCMTKCMHCPNYPQFAKNFMQQLQFEAMRFWVSVAVAQFKRQCAASDQIPVTVLIPTIQGCAGFMNTNTISPDGI